MTTSFEPSLDSTRSQGPSRGRGAFPSPLASRYIAGCGHALGGVLPPLLNALFGRVDDALYDLADKSPDGQSYSVYFDAMRIIRKQSRTIQADFLRLLRQGADGAALGLLECDLRGDSQPASDSLSLVKDTDLDETLAIGNLVSRAESRYHEALLDMNAYLARLLDRDQIDRRSNPYAPYAICEAFRGALDASRQLEPQIKLVIYKVFDKQVLDRLDDFYRQCLAAAVAAGYVRDGAAGRGAGDRRAADADADADADVYAILEDSGEVIALDPGSSEDSSALRFERLQDLLARGRTGPRPPPPGPSSGPTPDPGPTRVPTNELLGLLTRLGESILAEDGTVAGGEVRERLSSALGSADRWPRCLERRDQDTLDLVFMFFEHLFAGHALPDPIKVLLGRMQIPIAKLALLDKGFFSAPAHPARQLLNHIGEAAVGWGEADGRGPNSLYGMIERVTERLILDFDGDLRLFAKLDRFFLAYIGSERGRAAAGRVEAPGRNGTAATQTAQDAVTVALNVALTRYSQIPAVVESILREGWQPVMLAAWSGDGVESQDWHLALAVVERLLWSVQPKPNAQQRRQLLRHIPEMLRVLRARLVDSGCDQRQIARWFRALQTLHLSVLQGAAGSPPAAPAARTARAPQAVGPDQSPDPTPDLSLGNWIELTRDNGTKARYQLAGRGPVDNGLQFVDRLGQPGPALSGGELRGLLGQGRAIVVGDAHRHLADRAMRSVMGRLAS